MPRGGSKPRERRGGRQKGTRNNLTSIAREAIETAAAKLGGADRLAKWAKESPANERAFWTTIYPKLMPVQLAGPGDGPIAHYYISDRPKTPEEWEGERCGK
jgi:hypothetical protein